MQASNDQERVIRALVLLAPALALGSKSTSPHLLGCLICSRNSVSIVLLL